MVTVVLRYILILLFTFGSIHLIKAQSTEIGFVEAQVDNVKPYVGQPIIYTFRFFYTFTPFQETYIWPDFEGFGQAFQPEHFSVEVINSTQYTVYRQDILLYPLRAGEFTIGEAIITLPETPFQLGANLATEPIDVTVQPLPTTLSAYFTGAVGQYQITGALSEEVIQLGEKINLELNISGTGNIQQFTPPKLTIPENWQIVSRVPNFQPSATIPTFGTRQFIWEIYPSEAGRFLLDPVLFTYFDPISTNYQTIQTEPFILEVRPSTQSTQKLPLNITPNPLPLRPMPALEADQNNSQNVLDSLWPWLLSPALGISSLMWLWRTNRLKQKNQRSIYSQAFSKAQKYLRQAQRATPMTGYRQIDRAFWTYFADKLGAENGNLLRQDDIINACVNLPEHLRERVMQCLEQLGLAQYSPAYPREKYTSLLKYTLDTLKLVDEQWSNKR